MMGKYERHWTSEDADCKDDPAKLPASQKVTAQDLEMRPVHPRVQNERATMFDTHIADLAGGLGEIGLRPRLCVPRAGHTNRLKNRWHDQDWAALVRAEVAKGRARHIGDVLFSVALISWSAQHWGKTHKDFEQALFKSGVPRPPKHWPEYLSYIRHQTIDRYRELKAELMAEGLDETAAMHEAADRAVDELRYKTAQRRRVERDTLMGVAGHKVLLEKYRKGVPLTDAHSPTHRQKNATGVALDFDGTGAAPSWLR
jgi:hypothetical protein